MYDVIIIGAGASGLVSAIVSAKRGKRVLILEKNTKVGKKLLATGNGRCNISNQKIIPNRFHSQNPKFIERVLDGYNYKNIKEFFRDIGIEIIEAKEGRAFPMSLQASSVVDILDYECKNLGVEILLDSKVKKIIYKNGKYNIYYRDKLAKSEKLILALGNLSAPNLGGVEDGLIFSREFGHTIIKPYPSLVQLRSSMLGLNSIAGVKIEARVKFENREILGDILFTKYGISGLAILDISRFIIQKLKNKKSITIKLDLMPKMTHEQLLSLFKKSLKNRERPINIWLEGFLNKKIVSYLLKQLNLNGKSTKIFLEKNTLSKLIETIKSFEFIIDGDRGFSNAEVATGGVDTKEINHKSMESKLYKGLYIIGELLDIDGDRGGFNLHFAWVSGIRAGESI